MTTKELTYQDQEEGTTLVQHREENRYFKGIKTIDLFGRPSLIPNVDYPITKEEERLLDLAWEHAKNLSDRGLL